MKMMNMATEAQRKRETILRSSLSDLNRSTPASCCCCCGFTFVLQLAPLSLVAIYFHIVVIFFLMVDVFYILQGELNLFFFFFFSLSWLNFGKERGSFLWCCWPADWGTTMCDPKPCSRKIRDGWERKISFPPTWFSQMSESQDLRTSKKRCFLSIIYLFSLPFFIYLFRAPWEKEKKRNE